jgi:predicted transporter
MDLVLGLVYFLLLFALVINYDKKITNFIKSKDTDLLFGMKVLCGVFFLFLASLVFYTLKDYDDDIDWITNYFSCYTK